MTAPVDHATLREAVAGLEQVQRDRLRVRLLNRAEAHRRDAEALRLGDASSVRPWEKLSSCERRSVHVVVAGVLDDLARELETG